MRAHIKKYTKLETERMCWSKAAFDTQERALASRSGPNKKVYRCTICWCWHISSSPYGSTRTMVRGAKISPCTSA
jgi:hypothetical protein